MLRAGSVAAAKGDPVPFEAYFVDSGKGVHKHGVGIVTSAEIIASTLDDTQNEARGRQLRYALIDFTQTTELRVTPGMIPRILEISRKSASFSPGIFVAIVAPNPFAFAMSRIWQSFAEGIGLHTLIFGDRAEAFAWLKGRLQDKGSLEDYPALSDMPRPDAPSEEVDRDQP
jgi:hypothetical protein